MAQQLNSELNQRIIELITPFMTTQERHNYITPWCSSYSNLYSQINWSGADRTFTTHIVTLFLRYGSMESGKTALQFLLESVHKSMGLEDQAEVDKILYILREISISNDGSGASSTSVPKPSISQSSQRRNSYRHIVPWITKLNNRFVISIAALLIVLGFIAFALNIFNFISLSTTPIAKTPTTPSPMLTVTSTLEPTPTHVIITPAEMSKNISTSVKSYCTSLVGYNTQEEIKSVLAKGLGFDGPLNELNFIMETYLARFVLPKNRMTARIYL